MQTVEKLVMYFLCLSLRQNTSRGEQNGLCWFLFWLFVEPLARCFTGFTSTTGSTPYPPSLWSLQFGVETRFWLTCTIFMITSRLGATLLSFRGLKYLLSSESSAYQGTQSKDVKERFLLIERTYLNL